MSIKKHLSLLIIASSFTACSGSNSVKDDWPGINSLNQGNKTNVFDFNSKLSLPKMGKDISYTLTSTCNRKLPLTGVNAKKSYTKTSSFNATEKHKASEDIIDILPEEVLIYPEFFTDCSFQIKATNQNGSTQDPQATNLKLNHSGTRELIGVELPPVTEENTYLNAIPVKELEKLSFTIRNNHSIKNTQLLCFAKKLTNLPVLKDAALSYFNGRELTVPSKTDNFPIEYCIIKGADTQNKQTIISKRFNILNSNTINDLSVYVSSHINKDSSTPIFYSDLNTTYNLVEIRLYNHSNETMAFEFKAASSIQNSVHAIEGFKSELPSVRDHFDTSLHINTLPAKFFWTLNNLNLEKRNFNLLPKENKVLGLNSAPYFNCISRKTQRKVEEIGFIVALDKVEEILHFKQLTHNEFIKGYVVKGNFFDIYKLNKQVVSNLPLHNRFTLNRSSNFQFFFQNRKLIGETLFPLRTSNFAALSFSQAHIDALILKYNFDNQNISADLCTSLYKDPTED